MEQISIKYAKLIFIEIEVTFFLCIFLEMKQFMHNLRCLRPRLERKFNPEAYSSHTTSRPIPYNNFDKQGSDDDPDETDSVGTHT